MIQRETAAGSPTLDRLGMRAQVYPDGRREVEVLEVWEPGSGTSSTAAGMADVAEVAQSTLIDALIASGAYASEQHVLEGLKVGTRVVVEHGAITEVSVRGRVYMAAGTTAPSLDFFLKEGAAILGGAKFGLCAGDQAGADVADGYDARFWIESTEHRGVLLPQVSPWRAIDEMVRNIGNDVPKAGGGMTRWSFDCFELVPLVRIYAAYRMMTKRQFNETFRGFQLGFHSQRQVLKWGEPITSERPGDPPTKAGSLTGTTGPRGEYTFTQERIPVEKTWTELLRDAPVGTQVVWTNLAAKRRCAVYPKLQLCNYVNENAIKVGPDQYAAHPWGVLSEAEIKERMAQAAIAPVPAGYIERNLFVATMRVPK